MKTYVVNMEKDTQKRALIEQQLQRHPELNWQIWKAVEGRKLSEEEQKEMILPQFYERYGRNATLPAAGCSLSHIAIYRDIVASNTNYALILEDDAILANDFSFAEIIKILDTDEPTAILMTPDFWYKKNNLEKNIDKGHKIYKVHEAYMTSGYLINKAGATLILRHNYPVQYTADAWNIFMEHGLKLYGIVPHIVSFPDGYGEIGISQQTKKTVFEKIRFIMVYCYIRFIWAKRYLKGNRRSLKKWK